MRLVLEVELGDEEARQIKEAGKYIADKDPSLYRPAKTRLEDTYRELAWIGLNVVCRDMAEEGWTGPSSEL